MGFSSAVGLYDGRRFDKEEPTRRSASETLSRSARGFLRCAALWSGSADRGLVAASCEIVDGKIILSQRDAAHWTIGDTHARRMVGPFPPRRIMDMGNTAQMICRRGLGGPSPVGHALVVVEVTKGSAGERGVRCRESQLLALIQCVIPSVNVHAIGRATDRRSSLRLQPPRGAGIRDGRTAQDHEPYAHPE